MDQDDLFRDQLKHAHALNALVDNHRFSLLQLLLTFHGIVLSTLIFRADMQSQLATRPWLALWLGAGVAMVGISLFGAFLSQHCYMRVYKKWIAALESHLHRIAVPQVAGHRGTLYWDENRPYVPAEHTLVLIVSVFVVLNIGVPAAVAILLGAAWPNVASMSLVVFFSHMLVWGSVVSFSGHRPGMLTPPTAPVKARQTNAHYCGNAITDSINHRGWFVGPFMTDRNPLLQSHIIEAKWGIHRAGEARDKWDEGSSSFSLTILLRGHLVQQFSDAEFNLTNEGDFVVWSPGVPHTWRVERDTVILTARWSGT